MGGRSRGVHSSIHIELVDVEPIHKVVQSHDTVPAIGSVEGAGQNPCLCIKLLPGGFHVQIMSTTISIGVIPLRSSKRRLSLSSKQGPVKVVVHSILSLNQISCSLLKVVSCVAVTGQASLITAISTVIHIVTLLVLGNAHFVGTPEVGGSVALSDRGPHSAVSIGDVVQCCDAIVVGCGFFEKHVEV